MSMFGLAGKTALVTGASSGLGAHFAHVLARAGSRVIVGARRVSALQGVVAQIGEGGGSATAVRLDVTDEASIAAIDYAAIDIVINNAGIVRSDPALSHAVSDWNAVVDTNLKGMFLVAQAAANGMRDRGGAIVNVASILGLRQSGGVVSYAVSKAGVIQLTKTLALEWARYGIRVNALAPGYIDTDLNGDFWTSDAGKALIRRIPQRRFGNPEDLDGPLLLLASDAGRYMTGSIVVVDGGHVVSGL